MIEQVIEIGKKQFTDAEQAFAKVEKDLLASVDSAAVPLSKEMRRTLQLVARVMRNRHSAGWNGGVVNPSDTLQRRSGESLRRMAQSIRTRGTSINSLEGLISSGFWAIHEKGGTITAKRARYLTIPLPPALDSRGVPLRRSARDWDNTFVARSRRGNLLIFQKQDGGRRIVPLYLLKSSVTIRPRLGMERTIIGTGVPYFERKALDVIERAIDQMFQ